MDHDQNGTNNNDNDKTRLQSYLKDQFEMLLQEVNNFQKTHVPALEHSFDTSGSVIRFADDPMSSKHSDILHEYNRLLQDFHELECTMIPDHQKDTMYVTDLTDANLLGTSQNPEAMMEKNESQNVATWGLNDAIGVAQMTDFIGGCGSSQGGGTATCINSSASGIGSRGGMLTSLVNFTNVSSFGFMGSIENGATSSISRISSWRQGGVREMPKRRQKRRRRYRGVYQTEEEALLKQERLKIKQRATSAEAYQKKKDYIIRLEEQVQRLPSEKQRTGKSASKATEENVLRTHIVLSLDTIECYLEQPKLS
ncbi:hypothetical protein DCAR_0935810 [Daucus carota subsp. sativus]|uniref:Uncharacterized protein n=1 Tax=Daucus carota subsp. sativus TaxID=79200 RepID=A0A175YIA4_DAUCS|nr:hypothetical protein DCAR_0935810 [Daucus carota subsp. sativus]